jgi:TonB-dependent SusC/RagA subfamily outer membrane receptor
MWRLPAGLMLASFVALPAFAQQEEGLITGRVTSDQGAPLGAAQITLDNMGLHALTKDDGSYRLVVPASRANGQTATLSVRLIGFKPKTQTLVLKSGEQTADFVLPPQAVVLQQVVVTGEGIITTNEKLGETINTVTGEQVTNSNESNLVNALSAKAPNVQIQSQSGDPGSSTSIQIRGIKSFSGDGQPLFVVDGVPIDNSTIASYFPGGSTVAPNRISDVNPADIESVTILKGAAASAIYGARASQGVVLITTKNGKSGATRYSLTASYASNSVTQGFPLQRTFGQGFNCTVPNCSAVDVETGSWGPALPAGTTTYDHFGEMFETGSIGDVVLSISGGDDRRSFYFSSGYSANQGFVVGPNDAYDRVTFNLRASQMLADRMQVSAKFSYVNTEGLYVQRGNNIDGIMLGGLRTPPEFNNFYYLDSTYGLHRSYIFPNPDPASLKMSRGFDNPIFSIFEEPNSSSLHRFYGNVDFNWTPNDWLTLQWTPGLDYYTDSRYEGEPWTTSCCPDGLVFRADLKNFIVSSVITAVGQHTFNPNFSGTLTVGNEINSTSFDQLMVFGGNLITAQPLQLSNTQDIYVPNDYQQQIHRQSFFGQVTADFWDQLFVTAAVRNDGYSTFGQNNPRAWYPKASAAWTVSKTVGASGRGTLQYAKLRAAYGQTGKEPEPYSTLASYWVTAWGPGVTQ